MFHLFALGSQIDSHRQQAHFSVWTLSYHLRSQNGFAHSCPEIAHVGEAAQV